MLFRSTSGEKRPVPIPDLLPVPIPALPKHLHEAAGSTAPEILESMVSLAPSSKFAVFVAPSSLTVFDLEPGREEMQRFQAYRAQRILVMAPTAAIPRMKALWNTFSGNTRDELPVASIGQAANVDLPPLALLKMMLDRRLLEAGLWNQARVTLDAALGSELSIEGQDAVRSRVKDWVRRIAEGGVGDEELVWAREAALNHLDEIKPHLQSLVWMRDRGGALESLEAITARHVQDVARIYF